MLKCHSKKERQGIPGVCWGFGPRACGPTYDFGGGCFASRHLVHYREAAVFKRQRWHIDVVAWQACKNTKQLEIPRLRRSTTNLLQVARSDADMCVCIYLYSIYLSASHDHGSS